MVRSLSTSGFLRWIALAALLVATLVPALRPLGAAAQGEAQSFTSPLTGQVIQTTGPWVIDTASVDSSPNLEMILLYGEFDGMMVAYMPAGTNLDAARDIFLQEFSTVFDSFTQIDRGAYGTVSYSLDIASTEGVEFGVFSLFLGQRASGFVEYYLYFGPVSLFQQGFSSAQANVKVGGNAVFDGVDPAGLQNLLNANAGTTGGSTQAPSTNVVQEEVQQDQPAPTQPPAPPAQPTQPPAQPPADGPASNDGATYIEMLEGELSYLEGTLVTFITNFASLQEGGTAAVEEINRVAGEWATYPDVAAGISAPPGFEDIHADYLALANDVQALAVAWDGVVQALQNNGDVDAALATFQAGFGTVQTGIVDIRGALDARGGTSQPAVPPTEAPQPTQAAQPTQPPEPEPTEEDIVDLTGGQGTDDLGNETETGQGSESVDLTEFEDLGLVADDTWVSPQHDVEITWEEGWAFDAGADQPIISDTSNGQDGITLFYRGADDEIGLLYIDVVPSDGLTPEDLRSVWVSDDFLQENGAELVIDDANRRGTSAAVITTEFLQDGTELQVLREATCADDACESMVVLQLISASGTFPNVFDAARGGVMLDGSRLLGVFSNRDIEGLAN